MAATQWREYLNGNLVVPLHFFAVAALTDGGMLSLGQTDAVAHEAAAPGQVMGYSAVAAGTLTACAMLVHVAGSAVAASAFTLTGAAAFYGWFKPGVITFAAGDAIAVELDSETTSDEMNLVLFCLYEMNGIAG